MKLPLYLCGRMSGMPQFNHPTFHRAAKHLRDLGYEIINPAELDSPEMQRLALESPDGVLAPGAKLAGETWGDVLARDVRIVSDGVRGLVFLPDWAISRGARLEAFVALLSGKTSYYLYQDGDHPRPIPAAYVRQIIRENMP